MGVECSEPLCRIVLHHLKQGTHHVSIGVSPMLLEMRGDRFIENVDYGSSSMGTLIFLAGEDSACRAKTLEYS